MFGIGGYGGGGASSSFYNPYANHQAEDSDDELKEDDKEEKAYNPLSAYSFYGQPSEEVKDGDVKNEEHKQEADAIIENAEKSSVKEPEKQLKEEHPEKNLTDLLKDDKDKDEFTCS